MEEEKDGKNERENNSKREYSGDLNDIFGEKPEVKKEDAIGGINDNNRYGQNAYGQNNYNQNGYPQNGFDSRGYNPYGVNPGAAGRALPQNRGSGSFVKVFVAIFLAIMLFAGGFLTAYTLVPSEEELLARWIKNKTDQYFYDVDGSGVDFIGNIGNAMVGSLDQYSSFYAGKNLETLYEENRGVFEDTGMVLYQDEGSPLVYVLKVYGGSPSDTGGLKAGDVIKSVNGADVSAMDLSEIRTKIKEEQEKAPGAAVNYVFQRYTGTWNNVSLSFGTSQYTPVFSKYYDSESTEMTGVNLGNDTAYISFEEFSANADTQFAEKLATFREKGKKNLILDLRTNFGGSLAVLQSMASHLITDGVNNKNVLIINAEFKNKTRSGYKTTDNFYGDYGFNKIVVLANSFSASATEVLICAMKDYGTIDGLVGTNTYGKAVMQTFYNYGNKFGMYITTALLFSPVTDTTYNTIGFAPDMEKQYNPAGSFYYDNQFMAAVSMAEIANA